MLVGRGKICSVVRENSPIFFFLFFFFNFSKSQSLKSGGDYRISEARRGGKGVAGSVSRFGGWRVIDEPGALYFCNFIKKEECASVEINVRAIRRRA